MEPVVKPICDWKMDASGFVQVKDAIEPEGGCVLPSGFKGLVSTLSVVTDKGVPVENDWVGTKLKVGKPVTKHKNVPTTTQEEVTVVDATTMATVASVGVSVPVAPPAPSMDAVVVILVGMVSGALSSVVVNLLKSKKKTPKQEEKKESSECRTHNMKCVVNQKNTRKELDGLTVRVLELESKSNDGQMEFSPSSLDELAERIERLENKSKK
jgi:hypothetical protein